MESDTRRLRAVLLESRRLEGKIAASIWQVIACNVQLAKVLFCQNSARLGGSWKGLSGASNLVGDGRLRFGVLTWSTIA